MNDRPFRDDATVDDAPSVMGRDLRSGFLQAWEAALQGAPPPSLDQWLENLPPDIWPALRAELEPLDRVYRDKLAQSRSGDRVNRPSSLLNEPVTLGGQSLETGGQTIDEPRDRTVDFVETPSSDELRHSPDRPQVPGHEIFGELGRGGIGVVYRARHIGLDRIVALKMLLAGGHASHETLARFHAEAQAVARLQHPNIVQIYEVGEHQGLPYFSLEYVDGGGLETRLDREPQPPRAAAALVETLARAMHYAHQQGVIHRDLKPGNVLLTRDGSPKITDFGLAKRLEGDAGRTQAGQIMGTPRYMAPEQARGEVEQVGPLADVYALGAILYEALTGRAPFMGATILDTLEQVRTREPVPPTRLTPTTPRDLETICLKCLQKDPAKRYESAGALADDLRRFLDGRPILARPVGPIEQFVRWCRRNPRVATLSGAVAALLLLAVLLGVKYAVDVTHERNQKEDQRKEAEARKIEAEQARDLANERNEIALNTVASLVREVQLQLKSRPGLEPVRLNVLAIAARELPKVTRTPEGATFIDRRASGIRQQVGEIYLHMDRPKDALEEFKQAHAIVEEIARREPDTPLTHRNLAASHHHLAEANLVLGHSDIARQHFEKQLEDRREWLRLEPDSVNAGRELANAYSDLGRVSLVQGRPQEALGHYRAAKEQWDKIARRVFRELAARGDDVLLARREQIGVLEKLGDVSTQLGDGLAAAEAQREVLRLRQALLADAGGEDLNLKRDIAISHLRRGDTLLLLTNDPKAAREEYRQSRSAFEELLKINYPNAPTTTRDVSVACYRIGAACRRLGDSAGAAEAFQASLALREKLGLKAPPENVRARTDLMLAQAQCGQIKKALALADEIAKRGAKDARVQYNVGCALAICAATAPEGERAGLAEQAVQALRRAVANGWKDPQELRMNPELDAIRPRPDFAALLADLDLAAGKKKWGLRLDV